jgi:hypothetical protein
MPGSSKSSSGFPNKHTTSFWNIIFSLLSKNEKKAYKITSLSLPPPPITSDPIGRFGWRSCHWKGPRCGNFCHTVATILKCIRFKLLRWM